MTDWPGRFPYNGLGGRGVTFSSRAGSRSSEQNASSVSNEKVLPSGRSVHPGPAGLWGTVCGCPPAPAPPPQWVCAREEQGTPRTPRSRTACAHGRSCLFKMERAAQRSGDEPRWQRAALLSRRLRGFCLVFTEMGTSHCPPLPVFSPCRRVLLASMAIVQTLPIAFLLDISFLIKSDILIKRKHM